jgi:hypothetical protein
MDEKKFGELMDKWLSQEMKAAPEISPTEEVYRKLSSRQKKATFWLFGWPLRLAAAGLAAALIILVVMLRPPRELETVVGVRQEIAADRGQKAEETDIKKKAAAEAVKEEKAEAVQVEEERKTEAKGKLEKGTVAGGALEEKEEEKVETEDRLEIVKQPERAAKMQAAKSKGAEEPEKPGDADKKVLVRTVGISARPKAEEKQAGKDIQNEAKLIPVAPAAPAIQEGVASGRIEFQYQPKGSGSVQELDIRTHHDEIITLSSEDNYRLLLQLPRERYVYIFQVSADKRLIRLFPNSAYHPDRNPLQPGKNYVVPLPPGWFYVEDTGGEASVYVVTTSQPKQEWDELYVEYESLDKTSEKKNVVSGILDEFKALEESPTEETVVYVFKFRVGD